MRSLGIHLSYWQTSWSDDLLPLIRRARQAGFDGAEFPMLNPQQMDFQKIKTMLDSEGMRATCSTGLSSQTDITHPNPAIRAEGLALLRQCLEGAQILGSPVLVGVTYAAWGVFPEGDWAERRKTCITSLRELGILAGDLGITLCLEVLNRFEGYLIPTVEKGLALLDEIGSPNIKLHLDTFHLNIEEAHLSEAIRRAGKQVGHFHCSENHRGIPGSGHIPWREIKAALDEIDYRGWIVVESFIRPECEVGKGLFIWQSRGDDLDGLARSAVTFLRKDIGIA
jgi:D-psicose/D-tagatose/L-ribulose 3-epimerase